MAAVSSNTPCFADLYAAHARVEAAAIRFVRLSRQAHKSGFTALEALAECCARRCMERSLQLESQIKSLL